MNIKKTIQQIYRLTTLPNFSLEQAWAASEELGIEVLYGSEEEGEVEVFVSLSDPDLLIQPWVKTALPTELPTINWEEQWALHGQNFYDGYVHYGHLRLKPGAGFGDLSHPTTRLMLKLLEMHSSNQIVIDIGCGSGILTLAAVSMGAPFGYGVDIDAQALEHASQNALLNGMEEKTLFCLPEELKDKSLPADVCMLMNMIQSEQVVAWSALFILHPLTGDCLTSGVRQEERETYLTLIQQWGWSLQHELEEDGWLAFCFKISRSK